MIGRVRALAVSPEQSSDDGDPLLFPIAIALLALARWIFGG
jgi:hypothetical protein